ncbi:MAG: universal stress protein [bacterium]
MIKSILLSVDGSAYTNAQLKYAIQLGKAFGSKINVISIVDVRIFEWVTTMATDGFVPVIPSTVYQQESKAMLEAKADAVLKKCASIIQRERLDFETDKIHGPPADIIIEKSKLVDLLIIGTRGEFARWESKMVGATLEAVARQCPKPIVICPKNFKRISKILIAYDGSSKANKALQMAGFFAVKLQAPVCVVTVSENEQMQNKHLQEAQIYLEPYGILIDLIGKSGQPDKEIIAVAQEQKCDFIVMGAFGHSRIREAILGSITEQIMRHAKIPLLLCK